MKYLYRTYQLLICLPLFLLSTMLTATVTALGCALGAVNFFGYHPGRLWSKLTIRSLLLPIRVEGREHLRDGQSYVFVANHQGAFDMLPVLLREPSGKTTTDMPPRRMVRARS